MCVGVFSWLNPKGESKGAQDAIQAGQLRIPFGGEGPVKGFPGEFCAGGKGPDTPGSLGYMAKGHKQDFRVPIFQGHINIFSPLFWVAERLHQVGVVTNEVFTQFTGIHNIDSSRKATVRQSQLW